MAQVTTGIRASLSRPWAYDAFQRLMGGHVGRTDFAREMIRAEAGSRVLDVGCGTGELLAYLPERIAYAGYDISPDYIAAATARFGPRGRFTCGRLREADVLTQPPFHIVIGSALLHHLDDEAAVGLLRLARLALRAGGRFVSIDPVFVPRQNRVARFLIARDRGRNVREPDGYLALARPVFDEVRGLVRHRMWVPYTHWMMEGTVDPPQRRS